MRAGVRGRSALLLCAVLLLPGSLFGIDLRTDAHWEYSVGSQGQTVEDAAGLSFAPLPGFEGLEKLAPGQVGFLWIRATYRLPDSLLREELALLLGRMHAAEEVYLNGEKIGEGGRFPPRFFSDWNRSRYFRLTSLRVQRDNTVLVKLYVHHEGSISGSLMVDERHRTEREYRRQEFLRVELNAVVSALLVLMAFYHLSIYLQRRRDRYNLYYAVLAIAFAIHLSIFFVTAFPRFLDLGLPYLAFQKIMFASLCVALFAACLFVADFLDRGEPRWLTISCGAVLAAAVLLLAAAPDLGVFNVFRGAVQYVLLVPVLSVLSLLFGGLLRRRRSAAALLAGVAPQVLAILYDLVAHGILKTSGIYLSGFGVAAFAVAVPFILSSRLVGSADEADRLNRRLEVEAEDRASELRTAKDDLEESRAELKEAKGKLEGLAITDSLTGVFNRRAFELRFDEELRRGRRNHASISLLMIDIDSFKKVNDARGHLFGDQCLVAVASTIRKGLMRPADFLARYGGEEFVVLLPETPLPGAEQVAQRIRAAVEELPIPCEGDTVRLTVSIGASGRLLETEAAKDAILTGADGALREAKSQGRNRVVAAL
jgi:diguanylate cyclase (GGDEF)-like protein